MSAVAPEMIVPVAENLANIVTSGMGQVLVPVTCKFQLTILLYVVIFDFLALGLISEYDKAWDRLAFSRDASSFPNYKDTNLFKGISFRELTRVS